MARVKLSQLSDETIRSAAKIVADSIDEPELELTPEFIRLVKIAAIAGPAFATAISAAQMKASGFEASS